MDAAHGLAVILRDARILRQALRSALLRMRVNVLARRVTLGIDARRACALRFVGFMLPVRWRNRSRAGLAERMLPSSRLDETMSGRPNTGRIT
jgi:hypothetical protein